MIRASWAILIMMLHDVSSIFFLHMVYRWFVFAQLRHSSDVKAIRAQVIHSQ